MLKVEDSTSKAQNVNAALRVATGEFVGIFDADHHPAAGSFDRAWRWIAAGHDVVQGHCVIRNGEDSALAKLVAVEFEQIYAVAHPGRAAFSGFGIFGGSNGYWRTTALERIRLRGSFLTEDIEASMRTLDAGGSLVSDPGLVSYELAPENVHSLWKQRLRWAQGWFQVSVRHLWSLLKRPHLTLRQKVGLVYLLGWREVYPWISMFAWPLLWFLAWRDGGLQMTSPLFVLITLFVTVSGPLQTLAAYRLGAPEIRRHKSWFVWSVPGQPARLHRVQEPREPHRPPQAAPRRAPVGGHAAQRSEHGSSQLRPTPSPTGRRSQHDDPTARTPDGRPATGGTDRRIFPLNTLRAIAALSVVVFHAYQYSRSGPEVSWPWEGLPHQLMIGTEMFVEMFFVLSGLVLWLPVARALSADQETRPGARCCCGVRRGCCRSTGRWSSSSGACPTRHCPGTGRTCCCT